MSRRRSGSSAGNGLRMMGAEEPVKAHTLPAQFQDRELGGIAHVDRPGETLAVHHADQPSTRSLT